MGKLSKILASEGVLPKQAALPYNTRALGRDVKKILDEALSEAGLRVMQEAAEVPKENQAQVLSVYEALEKVKEFVGRNIAS